MVLNYVILIRTLIGAHLSPYLRSMWDATWMSSAMAVVLALVQFAMGDTPPGYLLAIQVAAGAIAYGGLLWLRKRSALLELRAMLGGVDA
jgi:lipopolysaccharide exporter